MPSKEALDNTALSVRSSFLAISWVFAPLAYISLTQLSSSVVHILAFSAADRIHCRFSLSLDALSAIEPQDLVGKAAITASFDDEGHNILNI